MSAIKRPAKMKRGHVFCSTCGTKHVGRMPDLDHPGKWEKTCKCGARLFVEVIPP